MFLYSLRQTELRNDVNPSYVLRLTVIGLDPFNKIVLHVTLGIAEILENCCNLLCYNTLHILNVRSSNLEVYFDFINMLQL